VNMPPCEKCGGSGVIEKDGKTYECQCALLRRLAAAMPGFVRVAIVSKAHIVHPITDDINKNYLIDAAWSDARALIKVAMYKHPNLHFRITSDREIRDVGVGSTSRQARGDDATIVFNSLQDYMEPPKLVIVRLNELGYKNRAAAGLLEEALNIRVDRGLTTWVLNNKNKPFSPASHAYSEAVWDLIHTAFKKIDIPRIACPPAPDISAEPVTKPVQEEKPKHPASQENKPPTRKPKIRSSPDGDADEEVGSKLGIYGSGLGPKSRKGF
jgi:hypothetical protein